MHGQLGRGHDGRVERDGGRRPKVAQLEDRALLEVLRPYQDVFQLTTEAHTSVDSDAC